MNITPAAAGSATYCPEDNKLRLYVGRVPRAEYEALRTEGWTATPKQNCNFVAHWTPARRDTALAYGDGFIGDEDQSPSDRAADRAERFGDYRDKRTSEAVGHADRYDAAPVHGYQSEARAERAAARHDRIADRAGDAWSKAEYWQTRTAGVISHALHISAPGVRMGRIKELEAEIRKAEKAREEYVNRRKLWQTIAACVEVEKQNRQAEVVAGSVSSWVEYTHPRTGKKSSLYSHVTDPIDPITGAEAAALYLAAHSEIGEEGDWLTHYRLRLAYENQMLEAQGGRAGVVEMVPGGWLRGGRRLRNEERQIVKVNKSPATGRVVSVLVRDNHASSCNHWGNLFPDGIAKVLSRTVEVERMDPDAYRAPTAEELAAFQTKQKADKNARKASAPAPIPLVNPTDADAERLAALWNANRRSDFDKRHGANAKFYEFKPCEVRRMPQAFYSAHSKGSYAKAETRELCALARLAERNTYHDYSGQAERAAEHGPALCEIRTTGFDPVHIIILTDKPQKPLPASVWEQYVPAVAFTLESV